MIINETTKNNKLENDLDKLSHKSIEHLIKNDKVKFSSNLLRKLPNKEIEIAMMSSIVDSDLCDGVNKFNSLLNDFQLCFGDDNKYKNSHGTYDTPLISFIVDNFPNKEKDAIKLLSIILLSNDAGLPLILNKLNSYKLNSIDTFKFIKYAKRNNVKIDIMTLISLTYPPNKIFSNQPKDFDEVVKQFSPILIKWQ